MMRLGVCGYLMGKNGDGTSFDLPAAARQVGFDYVEFPLSTLAGLDEAAFQAAGEALARAGLPCEACNLLFPGNLRLTGADVDAGQVHAYLQTAMRRAGQIGARVVVFGSGGARRVPEGFPMEQAWVQLVEMLRVAGDAAREHGVTIAIEPLNRGETNVVTTAAEGFALAKLVDHPHVRLLLDLYHLYKEDEDYGIASTARDWLAHAHFAEPAQRVFPVQRDAPGEAFFAALRRAGYTGRVSVEASYRNFAEEAPRALEVMRALVG